MANLTLQPRRYDSQARRARKWPAIDIFICAAEYIGQGAKKEIKGKETVCNVYIKL